MLEARLSSVSHCTGMRKVNKEKFIMKNSRKNQGGGIVPAGANLLASVWPRHLLSGSAFRALQAPGTRLLTSISLSCPVHSRLTWMADAASLPWVGVGFCGFPSSSPSGPWGLATSQSPLFSLLCERGLGLTAGQDLLQGPAWISGAGHSLFSGGQEHGKRKSFQAPPFHSAVRLTLQLCVALLPL